MNARLGFAVCLCMLVSPVLSEAQKQRITETDRKADPADYPLVAHVTATRILDGLHGVIEVDATIDGHHYQLSSNIDSLLHLGDHKARVAGASETKTGQYARSFSLMLADGTSRLFNVIGETSQ